uniref:Serine-rich protein-like protein n=1 Tax=Kalanchoe fedtschenkoi TaxID=63787 RepID=A0A7N0RC75_KALFE
MAFSSSRRKSNASVKSSSATGFASSSSGFASSSASTFSSPTINCFRNSTAATRSSAATPTSHSVRFGFERRAISPSRSISAVSRDQVVRKETTSGAGNGGQASSGKRMCMCSPTTHPGSFRCSLHKSSSASQAAAFSASNRLNARRSAMTNSLVRIGTVEGDLVKRALAALIRPSSHQQRRRSAFQPRPSRLSVMSKADDS